MMRIIRVRLEGADAEPGRVAAADAARIILGLERAIARAAYLVLGKSRRGTGRHIQAIESAARLRFVAVEQGSFIEVLALPEVAEPTDDELPIPVADLSSQAFDRLLDVIQQDGPDTDAELATVIAQMAVELGIGDRNTSITLSDGPDNSPRSATIDRSVRERMQRLSRKPPEPKDQTLAGLLVEGDFEENTARLRLADGGAVTVKFSSDLADDIQEALRSRAWMDGVVHYHSRTGEAVSIELRSVRRSTQLLLDGAAFWRSEDFARLQAAQGTTGRLDPTDLAIADLTHDERAAFLAALGE